MQLAHAIIELLHDEGIDRVFGNPGTTELAFADALSGDPRLPYVLGVHEGPLVATADGYARATGGTAFVNLHVAAGTANGLIGMLNASRSRTPMVVTAGQQDSRHLVQDPMLSGDLVAMATGVAKDAIEARHAGDVPLLLRRAFRAAVSPPQGPVFLSIPMDLMEHEVDTVPARSTPEPVAPAVDLGPVLELLGSARRPCIVAGDGVGRSGAVQELVRVAHRTGALVYHAPMNDRLNFPMNHPSYRGMLPPENASIRNRLDEHDVVLLAGVRAFVPHHYSAADAIGPRTALVQIDDDPAQVGRTYPVQVGLVGDLRLLLSSLADALEAGGGAARPAPHVPGSEPPVDATDGDGPPLAPREAAATVARHLPPGAIVVEEAITQGLLLREHLRLDEPGSFHHTVGGGLGWGIGAATGVALGRPDRRVVAALGDGSALFGLQGLWTAARERAGVTFVVFANHEYRTLKQTLTTMRDCQPAGFTGMDLDDPRVAWPELSTALGVPGVRADGAGHLAELLAARDAADGPLLVEVPVRGHDDP